MNQIGQILKSRREELGYSLSLMSEKTKVPLAKLQAIEEGNLAYFKDELTYVKFYVRYYFNALHLNYEDHKELLNEALDEFTQTAALKKIEELEESTNRVKHRTLPIVKSKNKTTQQKNIKTKVKANVGYISMFVISILIVLALIYVFFSSILPMLNASAKDPKVIVVPDPIVHEDDPTDPSDPVDPVVKVLTVTAKDSTHFEITGYNADQQITLIINQPSTSSWLGAKINGAKVAAPATGLYARDAVFTLITNAKDETVIEIRIGYVFKQEISINGMPITIDPTLITLKDTAYFYFTFKGAPQ